MLNCFWVTKALNSKNFILFSKQELFFGIPGNAWVFVIFPTIIFYNISLILAVISFFVGYIIIFFYTLNDKDRVSITLKRKSLKGKRYVF